MIEFMAVVGSFIVVFLLISIVFRWFVRRSGSSVNPASSKIFACGEDYKPAELDNPASSYFSSLIKVFGLNKLNEIHNGDLSRYLTWVLSGMVVIMIYLLLAGI